MPTQLYRVLRDCAEASYWRRGIRHQRPGCVKQASDVWPRAEHATTLAGPSTATRGHSESNRDTTRSGCPAARSLDKHRSLRHKVADSR
jgi:hypothetical protein